MENSVEGAGTSGHPFGLKKKFKCDPPPSLPVHTHTKLNSIQHSPQPHRYSLPVILHTCRALDPGRQVGPDSALNKPAQTTKQPAGNVDPRSGCGAWGECGQLRSTLRLWGQGWSGGLPGGGDACSEAERNAIYWNDKIREEGRSGRFKGTEPGSFLWFGATGFLS